jgi:hypothetical protein
LRHATLLSQQRLPAHGQGCGGKFGDLADYAPVLIKDRFGTRFGFKDVSQIARRRCGASLASGVGLELACQIDVVLTWHRISECLVFGEVTGDRYRRKVEDRKFRKFARWWDYRVWRTV